MHKMRYFYWKTAKIAQRLGAQTSASLRIPSYATDLAWPNWEFIDNIMRLELSKIRADNTVSHFDTLVLAHLFVKVPRPGDKDHFRSSSQVSTCYDQSNNS